MKHTKYVVTAALVAAIYVLLTYVSAAMGLASNPIQIRLSEALTVLPYFTAAAVPGLTVGCFLANLLTGGAVWDIIFGTLATFIGAVITHKLRNKNKLLAPVPPILSNTVTIPLILHFVYSFPGGILYFSATVFAGEFLSCGVLGVLLISALEKHKRIFD